MYSVTCVGNRYFFNSFSSNVFKLIILTYVITITSDVLIFFVLNFVGGSFTVKTFKSLLL